jgi:hypothetical protein
LSAGTTKGVAVIANSEKPTAISPQPSASDQNQILGVDPAAPGSEKSILTIRQTINSWSDCIKFNRMIDQNERWGFKLLDVVDLPNGQTSATFERVK